jgi:putative ABC transport system substrate-binding protein
MKRRRFIALIGAAAAGWPPATRAQPANRIYRVGLIVGDTVTMASAIPAFRDELGKLGYIEGRNIAFEMRRAQQSPERLQAAATELVRWGADVIVASTVDAIEAALAASQTTPIVIWANNFDPIARGYVKSLAHPGGRLTGVFNRQLELAEKQVELLKDAFPERKRIGFLWDGGSTDQHAAAERRSRALGLEPISVRFERLPYDIPAAFQSLADRSAQLLLVLSTPFLASYQDELVAHAIERKLPAMFILRTYVAAGGLISYGVAPEATFARIANLVAKILDGAEPASLPVEQPVQYHLAVNLKTAQQIGVELPVSILLRADEVIE